MARKRRLFNPYLLAKVAFMQFKDTETGADVIVAPMGLTTKGTIGARTLDDCVRDAQAIADAAREVSNEITVLYHGGPITIPARNSIVSTPDSRSCRSAVFVLEVLRAGHEMN